MPVRVELLDGMKAAAAAGAGVLDDAREARLFRRFHWMRLTAEHCPMGGHPLIAKASDGCDTAWLFFQESNGKAEALTSWYSLDYGVSGSDDPALLQAIAAELRGRLGQLALQPFRDPAPIIAAFRQAGWLTLTDAVSVNWRIDTNGMDFDTYWATRPSRLRNTAARKAKKALTLDIAIATSFDAADWEAYEQVYRASWKPEEGSLAFLRALAEQEGAAGRLRLGVARQSGAPIAAQLWLVEHSVATIHKLAYAETAKALSPGTLLSMAMFRHVLDRDRVGAVDFGLGDDPYKADWMAETRSVYRVRIFNPARPASLLAYARARAGALVRAIRTR